MRIQIYELKRAPEGFVIDEKRFVALVVIADGIGQLQIHDPRREKCVRQLFEEPCFSFVSGGTLPNGACVDARISYPAWSPEAMDVILRVKLLRYNLGYKIVEENSRDLKSQLWLQRWRLLGFCLLIVVLSCIALSALFVVGLTWLRLYGA